MMLMIAYCKHSRKATEVLEKLTSGLDAMSIEYLNSCKELEKLAKDVADVKIELGKFINMAKKEEKQLSSRLMSIKKEEEKIRDKYFDDKQIIQESKATLLINRDLAEKKVQDMIRKIATTEDIVHKSEKEAELIRRKVKEVSSDYDHKLKNIFTHLEFIDRKRFKYMKEMTVRYSTIQTNTCKAIMERTALMQTSLEIMDEESEFEQYMTSCKANPTQSISNDSEQKRLLRISQASVESLKQVSKEVKSVSDSSSRFIDQQFPAQNASIDPSSENTNFKWMRAQDILGNSCKMISPETVLAHDIKPGFYQHDNFYAAISVIASHKPALIERLFSTKAINQSGIYELNMCVSGEWIKVVIDDMFPVDNEGNPLFGSTKSGDMWLLCLEKAFAKLCGCYKKIGLFNVYEMFEFLTGCPTSSVAVTIDKPSYVWKRLMGYVGNGNVTCCTTPDCSDTTYTDVGLAPRQTYSILGCAEVNGMQLIRLKTLKGKAEWNGAWCEHDNLNWTPEMRNSFNVDPTEGYFFMSLMDFVKFFNTVSYFKADPLLAKYQIAAPCSTINQKTETTSTPMVDITLESDQKEVYFGVHQRHDKFKGSSPCKSGIGFVVVRKSSGKVVAAIPISTTSASFTCLSLRAGEYQIVTIIQSEVLGMGSLQHVVVSTHARGSVKMKIGEKPAIKILPIQKSLLEAYKTPQLQRSISTPSVGSGDVKRLSSQPSTGSFQTTSDIPTPSPKSSTNSNAGQLDFSTHVEQEQPSVEDQLDTMEKEEEKQEQETKKEGQKDEENIEEYNDLNEQNDNVDLGNK